MIIGLPKEIKDNEYRVAITPGGTRQMVENGHEVLVQSGAGQGSGFSDEEYLRAGARLVSDPKKVWKAKLVVKVKEPQPSEYDFMKRGMILFSYLHLAAEKTVTLELMRRGVTGIAFETVEKADGSLPLLTPMSEVAGRMSIQVGAQYLEKQKGGRGKLLGGVTGVRSADVVIIGAGTVGTNAAQIALGMGANVVLLDIDTERLRFLDHVLHGRLTTLSANPLTIAEAVKRADLLIGAVLVKGGKAPCLVTHQMIKTMKPGSVVVDVSVDQGGCIETTRPTTHSNPVYGVDGVVHYGVTNMPGAVPRTSTYALSNAIMPYLLRLAAEPLTDILHHDPALARGVNVYEGKLIYKAVAEALDLEYSPPETIIT